MMSIRTYSRKRPHYQVIEDVHSLCRLCLTRAEQPVTIFTQQTDLCALATRIMICVGLEITNEECLPNIVCSNCLEMLEKYYNFRKQCEASYQKLKSHKAAIKIINYKEELKDKELIKTSNYFPPNQVLRNEGTKPIYFKFDSDGIVQICDENSKNRFAKQKLVSIIKTDEPEVKKDNQNISIEKNTNIEMHRKDNFESKVINSNRNENNILGNKLINGTLKTEITQSDKPCESYEQTVEVPIEENTSIIDITNTDAQQSNNINDRNSKNTVYSNLVDTKDMSIVEINRLVIEPVTPTRNTPNNIEVLDVEHVVIDDNVVMENTESTDERHEGNLIISEVDMNEVAADGLINITDHNQIDQQNSSLSEVLTTILLNAGVLTRHGDSLVVLDHAKAVHLETGDGNHFTLEFVEEPATQNIQEVTTDEKKKKEPVPRKKSKKLRKDLTVFESTPICSICGKLFATNSGVRRHKYSVHGRQRPHQCRVCGRSFGQKEVMLRHELVHRERRPFQCPSCPKSFTQRNALNTHARTHAPPHSRPLELFRCARCPKVFLYPSGLSRHMMTHSGRVFVCGGCQKAFKDKSSLKRHMNSAQHGLTPPVITAIQSATEIQGEST